MILILSQGANKSEQKIETYKHLTWFKYFLGKVLFIDDKFQNIFVYKQTFNTLELKEDKGTEDAIGWKLKGVYVSKLILLYTTFFHNKTL